MKSLIGCLSSALAIATIAMPVLAYAGPCSDDIATVGRQLSQSSSMGPVSSGTLSGSTPGMSANNNGAGSTSVKGTSADQRIGGTAGTKEMDAASSRVATSAADVRLQQAGHPTAAGQAMANSNGSAETHPGGSASTGGSQSDRMSQAKVAWQRAVDLNARNDDGCKAALSQAKQDLQGS